MNNVLTTEELVEYNKLILEFLDVPFDKDIAYFGSTEEYPECHPIYNTVDEKYFHYDPYYDLYSLPFIGSFDWIMIAVNKIRSMGSLFWIADEYSTIGFDTHHAFVPNYPYSNLYEKEINENKPIEPRDIFFVVIEFIKLYNKFGK